jgi:hypothetical protein
MVNLKIIISQLLQIDEKGLLSLWLADQVVAVVENEEKLANKVLKIAQRYINE